MRAWRPGLVMGVINGALPFTLIAWGEKHIDSGVAAIANATVPIWVAILAVWFNPAERSSGTRLAGIIVGLVGVGVVVGINPDGGTWWLLGTLAVVLASLSYAAGGLYGQYAVSRASGPVLATAAMLFGGNLASQVLFALVLDASLHAYGYSLPLLQLIVINSLASVIGGMAPVPSKVSIWPLPLRSMQPPLSPAIIVAEARAALEPKESQARLATTMSPLRLTVVRDGSAAPPGAVW